MTTEDTNSSTAAASGDPLRLPLSDLLGPVPTAWVGPFGLTMHHEIYTAWAKQYPDDARNFSPLYDAATIAARVAAEREQLLALAKKRADHEAHAAAHHASTWHAAHEYHLTRHAAMRDLIAVLEGPNAKLTGSQRDDN